MNKIRGWVIKKLGGVPKEYAHVQIKEVIIKAENRDIIKLRGYCTIAREELQYCNNPAYINARKAEVINKIADEIIMHYSDAVKWETLEDTISGNLLLRGVVRLVNN